MAQADYSIANQGFPATRAEINSTLEAIATNNSGTSAPSTQYAGQFWIDTTSSTWTLYIHDGTDDIQFATIDTSANTVNFTDSALDVVTDTTPQLGGDLDLNSNDITGTGNINITGDITASGNLTSVGIDDNATSTAITIDSSENVFIGSGTDRTVNLSESNGNVQIENGIIFESGSSAINSEILSYRTNSLVFGTGATEHMRITGDGNLAIGKTTATGKLEIFDSKNGSESSPHLRIQGSGYSSYHWLDTTAYYIGQQSNSRSLRIYSGSNEAVGAQLGAGGTSFGTYSDERLKKDITDLTNGLNKILALRPVNFKYKFDADDYRNRIGIIAQSIVGQVDEALDKTKITDDDETEYYNVRYQDLIPVLVKGMQEQQTKIEELEARITALENA